MSRARTRTVPFLLVLAVTALVGCDEGSVDLVVDGGATAHFSASGNPPEADRVRLVGRSTGEDEVTVDVVIAGPSTSDDLFGFYFGIEVGDPDSATFVAGSDVLGTALDMTGCSPIVLVTPTPDSRTVIVSVTKRAPCSGNGIDEDEEPIVSLAFRIEPDADSTIRLRGQTAGDPPFAKDSHAVTIPSVTFDAAPALLSGR
jgi:hypothetical protein